MVFFDEVVINQIWAVPAKNSEQKTEIIHTHQPDENTHHVLSNHLLKHFSQAYMTFEFTHNIDIHLNVVHEQLDHFFNEKNLDNVAENIYIHLETVATHHQIKQGDLIMLNLSNVRYKNKHFSAFAIFKIEAHESVIQLDSQQVQIMHGIGSRKPDKACLILQTGSPYTVLVIDTAKQDTAYWHDAFLQLKTKADEVNQTHQFLQLTKTFVTENLPANFEVSKADQIDFLNRSVSYFKNNEEFNQEKFAQEVFVQENIIQAFENYDQLYQQSHEVQIQPNFMIAPEAVKKQARIFKSVLKLDKNFHIYIHGNRELIEHGIDEDGRKFYKIYYQEEN